jgi:hypothetical protein
MYFYRCWWIVPPRARSRLWCLDSVHGSHMVSGLEVVAGWRRRRRRGFTTGRERVTLLVAS